MGELRGERRVVPEALRAAREQRGDEGEAGAGHPRRVEEEAEAVAHREEQEGIDATTKGTIHQRLRPKSAKSFGSFSTADHEARLPMKIIAPSPTSEASTTTRPKSRLPFQIATR